MFRLIRVLLDRLFAEESWLGGSGVRVEYLDGLLVNGFLLLRSTFIRSLPRLLSGSCNGWGRWWSSLLAFRFLTRNFVSNILSLLLSLLRSRVGGWSSLSPLC